MATPKRYWLMKSEPGVYAIDDLARDHHTHWDGVRNYQARNHMRDMTIGDGVLFYHSSADPPGVAGLAKVHREAYPDASAWTPGDAHFDAESTRDNPRWFRVDLAFVEKFPTFVPLDALKKNPHLEGMLVIRRGMRLSVQPVEPAHFEVVVAMGRAAATP